MFITTSPTLHTITSVAVEKIDTFQVVVRSQHAKYYGGWRDNLVYRSEGDDTEKRQRGKHEWNSNGEEEEENNSILQKNFHPRQPTGGASLSF